MVDYHIQQVKSKRRVADHGEVFTSKREVNAMLDLVKYETERIDSRFLEPACGTGNFLVEILKRKLTVVEARYSKNQIEYERYAILALSSIYGIDILEDNVQTCQDRLFRIFTDFYLNNYKKVFKPQCLKSAEFILNRNIQWGDALSLRAIDNPEQPIIFSEWSFVKGSKIKRRDFSFAELASQNDVNIDLFNDPIVSDLGNKAFLPQTIGEYPLISFLKLGEDASN